MANNSTTPGNVLDYLNAGSPISSEDVVVIGNLAGVAAVDIPTGDVGSVRVSGGHRVAKVAGVAWAQGDYLDYDASAGGFSKGITAASGDCTLCAFAAKAAAAGDTVGEIVLLPGSGTGI